MAPKKASSDFNSQSCRGQKELGLQKETTPSQPIPSHPSFLDPSYGKRNTLKKSTEARLCTKYPPQYDSSPIPYNEGEMLPNLSWFLSKSQDCKNPEPLWKSNFVFSSYTHSPPLSPTASSPMYITTTIFTTELYQTMSNA